MRARDPINFQTDKMGVTRGKRVTPLVDTARHAMRYTFRRRSSLLDTCKGRTTVFTFRKILCGFSKIQIKPFRTRSF